MTNFARLLTAAAVVSAFAATSATAAPVGASTPATAKAQIVKPLTLTKVQDLDFGTILLPVVPAAATVTVSSAGVATCTGGTTCAGSPKQAIFNLTGTNNQVVRIFSAATNLTNANDSTTIVFTPAPPATVTMPNSGNTGANFNVGGAIAITTTTTDGVYTGNMNVTVDYN